MITLTTKQMLTTIRVHYHNRYGVIIAGLKEKEIKSLYEQTITHWLESKHEIKAKLSQY